jgi:hypothetical protein
MFRNPIYGEYGQIDGLTFTLYHSDKKALQGFSSQILSTGYARFKNYLQAHNKTFFFTLTLTFPLSYQLYRQDNGDIAYFLFNLIQSLSRNGYDPAYFWVREKDNSPHHHYHLALWLNGNKIQHPQNVIDRVVELWKRCIGEDDFTLGLVDYKGAYQYPLMIRREDDLLLNFKKGFQTFSYLAKLYSKEQILPVNCRRYGCSQLKKLTAVQKKSLIYYLREPE